MIGALWCRLLGHRYVTVVGENRYGKSVIVCSRCFDHKAAQ